MIIKLSNTRLSFPHLFTAQQSDLGGTPKFGATFLFAAGSDNEQVMQEAIEAVGKEKWAAKWPGIKKQLTAGLKICLKDGDLKSQYEGYEGNLFVSTSGTKRPEVNDRDLTPLVEADGRPYGGCYVNAWIDVWPMDNKFGLRVCATLLGVQFVRDGDSFGGGSSLPKNTMVAMTAEDDLDDLA